MKRILLIITVVLSAMSPMQSMAQESTPLFQIPTITDESMTLTQRCNYMVYKYWDRCNIKQSFASMDRLNEAFGTWASFMPYATADTVHLAIDNYIKAVAKAAPKEMLQVGKLAQNWFYCDTAQYYSEELYMPFCKAVIDAKKVSKAEKAPYVAQYRILENCALGQKCAPFEYTKPDGSTGNFGNDVASRVILIFSDPECIDCRIIKTRLAADANLNALVDMGLVKVVMIYPDAPSDVWRTDASSYPEAWTAGCAPDIDTLFDIKEMPSIYYLDGRHKVIAKEVDIDGLLLGIRQIYNQQVGQ